MLSKCEKVACNRWRLRQLRWNNVYCYGSDNVIDFSILNNLVSLVGKNKTGKSAVLDILVYILFGEITRGSQNDLLNKFIGGAVLNIELLFDVQDGIGWKEYMIRLERLANKSVHTLYCAGRCISEHSKDVYLKMEELIGSSTIFKSSILSLAK